MVELLLRIVTELKVDFLVAYRNVLRQRHRATLGIAAVAFGVISLLLAAGFVEWIYWGMRESTIRSRLGHIQVVQEGYTKAGRADPFAFLLPESSPALAAIEGFAGVKTVAPRLMFHGLVSLGDATISFIGEGVRPEKEGDLADYILIVEGESLSSEDPNGIIMGQGLAANLGAKVGDRLVLLANTASGGINAAEVRVRGLFSSVTKTYDDTALRATLPTAQALLRVSGAHTWVVLLSDTRRTDETVRRLREALDGNRLELVPWHEMADFYKKTVALFSRQVGVVELIIGIIIILSVTNTLTMAVLERTSEIGTSMALGVTRFQLLRRFLLEGVLIGAIGGAAGLALGWVLAELISFVGIPMPPPPGMAIGLLGQVRVTLPLAVDAAMLALVTSLVASVYPAWRASRLEIVDALRYSR
jgi:putative ABC transport system permease protein